MLACECLHSNARHRELREPLPRKPNHQYKTTAGKNMLPRVPAHIHIHVDSRVKSTTTTGTEATSKDNQRSERACLHVGTSMAASIVVVVVAPELGAVGAGDSGRRATIGGGGVTRRIAVVEVELRVHSLIRRAVDRERVHPDPSLLA